MAGDLALAPGVSTACDQSEKSQPFGEIPTFRRKSNA